MNKTYKGWELLKAIADGEIKEGMKFECELGTSNKGFQQIETYTYEKGNIVTYRNLGTNKMGIYCDYDIEQFANGYFELISEPTEEIDIQGIEEINHYSVVSAIGGLTTENIDAELATISMMTNKLIKAIKQLDNKIKEQINE